MMRVLGILGARRLTDVVLVALVTWFFLLLAWTQASPQATVIRIGTMWTFAGIYGLLVINILACVIIELPRAWRRCTPRTVDGDLFPPTGYTPVAVSWQTAAEAVTGLRRRLFRVRQAGDWVIADRGRFSALLGMAFHLVLPLLLPAVLWSMSSRRVVTMHVGEGEIIAPVDGGPGVSLGVDRIDVDYFEDQVFFTRLAASVLVDGRPAGTVRINESLAVEGGSLRLSSMGFMPALEIMDPHGQPLERSFVKAGMFPPGAEAELNFAGVPHRLFMSFYPDAELKDGRPINATLNLRQPILKVRAVRGKLPIQTTVLPLGETMVVEGFRLRFADAGLWVALEWVHDPGGDLILILCVLAALLIVVRVALPRVTWVIRIGAGRIDVARRAEGGSFSEVSGA